MLKVLGSTWALLLGMMLLMLGNGMQGTLLGIRGAIEQFSTFQLSVVMSSYFVGFLFGSRLAPTMIQRVGHVRVFAALASMVSAVLLLYAVAPNWILWAILRVVIGFSFSGVYITAESWLNNATSNETRGQTLSLYLIVQMFGIIVAQGLLNVGDPGGFILFIIPSVLVSLSFAPILLSVTPVPAFETTRRMSFATLYRTSPLGVVGMFLLGGIFSAQFGMASVWATQAGLNVRITRQHLVPATCGGGGIANDGHRGRGARCDRSGPSEGRRRQVGSRADGPGLRPQISLACRDVRRGDVAIAVPVKRRQDADRSRPQDTGARPGIPDDLRHSCAAFTV
tara:strand:- start:792 stop:1808 length:1017 start_codon:yes stop_codon:yes gene_type:complete